MTGITVSAHVQLRYQHVDEYIHRCSNTWELYHIVAAAARRLTPERTAELEGGLGGGLSEDDRRLLKLAGEMHALLKRAEADKEEEWREARERDDVLHDL